MDSKEIIGGPKQSVIGQPIYTHFYTMCRPFLVLRDVMKLENQSGKFCSALWLPLSTIKSHNYLLFMKLRKVSHSFGLCTSKVISGSPLNLRTWTLVRWPVHCVFLLHMLLILNKICNFFTIIYSPSPASFLKTKNSTRLQKKKNVFTSGLQNFPLAISLQEGAIMQDHLANDCQMQSKLLVVPCYHHQLGLTLPDCDSIDRGQLNPGSHQFC